MPRDAEIDPVKVEKAAEEALAAVNSRSGPVNLLDQPNYDYMEVATCPSHGPNLYTCPKACPWMREFVRQIKTLMEVGTGEYCFSCIPPKAWGLKERRKTCLFRQSHRTLSKDTLVSHGHGSLSQMRDLQVCRSCGTLVVPARYLDDGQRVESTDVDSRELATV